MRNVIWLQTPTIFWIVGGTNPQLYNIRVHGVSDIRKREIHTTEPLVPELSAFEFDIAIEWLKEHKSPGID
jgi:hypothetical protein